MTTRPRAAHARPPTARAFPSSEDWGKSRGDGLAHSWLGWAWVWFQLLKAHLIDDDANTRRAVFARLKKEIARPHRTDRIGHLLGSGGAPVVAALAASVDPAFEALVDPAIARWTTSCNDSTNVDVMFGAAGALLASAEIESYLPRRLPRAFVRNLHRRSTTGLRDFVSANDHCLLGMAHGIAGQLLALEVARDCFGFSLTSDLRDKALKILSTSRLDGGRGMSFWPNLRGQSEIDIHGWCHGGPGIGLALAAMHRITGHMPYEDLRDHALAGCVLSAPEPISFCCGALGRTHILIEGFRLTENKRWLRAARRQASRAPSMHFDDAYQDSFHFGRLGALYLEWRLAYPNRLPLLGLGQLSNNDAWLQSRP